MPMARAKILSLPRAGAGCEIADIVGSLDEMPIVFGAEDASGLCPVDVKDDEEVD